MPTPKRTLIRQAVLAALEPLKLEGVTEVFSNRVEQYSASHLPVVSCYFVNEETSPAAVQSNSYRRTLSLRIDIIVEAESGIDDQLEQFQELVEEALKNNPLGGHIQGIELKGSQTELLADASAQAFGKCEINFEIKYTN